MSKFYAVAKGRLPGIYLTWDACNKQVSGFSGAQYKSFTSRQEAESFIGIKPPSVVDPWYKDSGSKKLDSSSKTKDPKPFSSSSSSSKEGPTIVYVDGAAPNNGKATIAGIGVHFPGNPDKDISEVLKYPPYTNNRAEVYAVIKALKITDGDIIVYSDSQYVINTMTIWLNKRIREGWSCLNADLFKKLYELSVNRNIEYRYVKGHSGDEGNEIADSLAVQACKYNE